MATRELWSRLQEWKNRDGRCKRMSRAISIPNPVKRKVYCLVERISKESMVFKAVDIEGKTYHVRILEMQDYKAVRNGIDRVKSLALRSNSPYTIPIIDYFPYFENKRWAIIVVTEYKDLISLEECLVYRRSLKEEDSSNIIYTKETLVFILLDLLKIINHFHNNEGSPLGVIYPDNIYIEKLDCYNPEGFCQHHDFSLLIKINLFSRGLIGFRHKHPHILPHEERKNHIKGDIWGLGVTLFAILSETPSQNLPPFSYLAYENRKEYMHGLDLAYVKILQELLRDVDCRVPAQDLLQHPIVRTLDDLRYKRKIVTLKIEVLPVFLLGLEFNDFSVNIKCLKGILNIAGSQKLTKVSEMLIGERTTNSFLKAAMAYDKWQDRIPEFKTLLSIITQRVDSKFFQDKCMHHGVLSLIPIASAVFASDLSILYEFIYNFSKENTSTVLQQAYDLAIVDKAFRDIGRLHQAKNFLMTISYCGYNSAKLFYDIWRQHLLPTQELLPKMREIPFYFKTSNEEVIIEILREELKNLRCLPFNESIECLNNIVLNLGELLCTSTFLRTMNLQGCCPTHYGSKNRVFKCTNPLLVFCEDCYITLCSICASVEHARHKKHYKLYQHPKENCKCISDHSIPEQNPADFKLPRFPNEVYIIDSKGKKLKSSEKNYFQTYSEGEANTVTTEECLESLNSSGLRCYYEIKIVNAGIYEDITLSYIGTSIQYKARTGEIFYNNQLASIGPRFGSYDTVGLGLSYQFFFVTYNGLIVHPLIPYEVYNDIKPCVTICGPYTGIEFKLSHWMFKPITSITNPPLLHDRTVLQSAEKILKEVVSRVINRCKASKVKKDAIPRMKNLVQTTEDLLIHLHQDNLYNEMAKALKERDCYIF
jgi:hypothetical protein